MGENERVKHNEQGDVEIVPREVITDSVEAIGPEDKENCLEAGLNGCGVITLSLPENDFTSMLHRSSGEIGEQDTEIDYDLVRELKRLLGVNNIPIDGRSLIRAIGFREHRYQVIKKVFEEEFGVKLPDNETTMTGAVRIYKKDGHLEYFIVADELDIHEEEFWRGMDDEN